MEPDNIKRPGHRTFIAVALTFLSLCGLFSYYILSLTIYQFLFIGLIVLLVKKYFRNDQDSTSAIFIKGQDKINVCVIGAGFSGLCMGVKLKKAGIKFRILEQGSEVGGTWTANQYPGCRCDVWSVLYQVNINNCIQYLEKKWTFWNLCL